MKVLREFAEINEEFISLYFKFRGHPAVKTVSHDCDIRKHNERCTVTLFVEPQAITGVAYCWWISINLEEAGWSLEASLLKTEGGAQDIVREFSSGTGSSLDELVSTLKRTAAEMVQSARSFEISMG